MPSVSAPESLLRVEDVLGILRVGRSTLYRLIRRKQDPIPSVVIGGIRRFKRDQVTWWIDKHEVS